MTVLEIILYISSILNIVVSIGIIILLLVLFVNYIIWLIRE